jgi:hypothetical protein
MKVFSCILAFIPFFNIISYIYAYGMIGIGLSILHLGLWISSFLFAEAGLIALSIISSIIILCLIIFLLYSIIKK